MNPDAEGRFKGISVPRVPKSMERDLRMEEGWAEHADGYFAEEHDYSHREKFWNWLIDRYPVETALEVGCGTGANLAFLKDLGVKVTGVDINAKYLTKDVEAYCCSATDMPFKDKRFDLVFTSGVLLHAPPPELPLQMAEIVRCSKRYVFALEYAGEGERHWRWMPDTGIWHRDYGGIYERDFGLKLLETGEQNEGTWLGTTWWMLER